MMMIDFKSSLSGVSPVPGVTASLAALWWAGKGDWNKAHEIVQDESGVDAAWVHAHLHRVEGDLANAGYWYRRAGRPQASNSLEDERRAIEKALSEAGG